MPACCAVANLAVNLDKGQTSELSEDAGWCSSPFCAVVTAINNGQLQCCTLLIGTPRPALVFLRGVSDSAEETLSRAGAMVKAVFACR